MSFLRPKNRLIPLLLLLIMAAGGLAYVYRQDVRNALFKMEQGTVPEAVTREDFLKGNEPTVEPAPEPVNEPSNEPVNAAPAPKPVPPPPPAPKPPTSGSINLSVLFIPQAPKQVWDEMHEETCEEAAIAMVNAYLKDIHSMSVNEMEDELQALVDYQMKTIGYYKSTNTPTTAEVMRGFYGLKDVKVVPLTSIQQIKDQIAAGHAVILPTAGRELHNPYFKSPGPIYHMVVAKGYTDSRIITNDPGTKRGADYTYSYDVLWNAIGEWTGSGMDTSIKSMIIAE